MATKIRKPKALKLPKRPKASASLDAWKKFEDRVKAVQKANKLKLSDYTKKVKEKESNKKAKETLQKKLQGVKAV